MNAELQAWLIQANRHYSKAGVPHRQRGFKALSDFSLNHKCSLSMDAGVGKEILDWFQANSPEGSHAIGSIFTGAFYYDTHFWPVHVPIIFGVVTLGPIDSLETMPNLIKHELAANADDMARLISYWCNCFDYGYGLDDLLKTANLSDRALALLKSADGELRGSISQLITPRPNSKAILALRMATELFLKTRLVHEIGISESELKRLGHNIRLLAARCRAVTGLKGYEMLEANAHRFPDVSARYQGDAWPNHEVANALVAAQCAAALFCGGVAGRNISASLRPTGAAESNNSFKRVPHRDTL